MHHALESRDTSEEDRAVEALYINMVMDVLRHILLVLPGRLLVKGAQLLGTVAILHEVAGTLHEKHAGDDHTNTYCREEVHKDRHEEDHDHHEGVRLRYAPQVLESAEVDDAPSYRYQNTGKHRKGYVFHERAQSEENGKEQGGVDHTAELRAATRLHVDHRTHRSSCAGKTTEQTRHGIADTLAYQLLVGIVLGLGDIVGHNRRQ